MTPAAAPARILRFGAFELDLQHEELRRAGVLIKLSPQQLRLLRFLAEHPGEICSRAQIRQEIWGAETFVDFDRGLTVCVAQIRAALNDDSESPRFIQTVPRKGYRFVAPVEPVTSAPKAAAPADSAPPRPRRAPWLILIAAVAAALFYLSRTAAPPGRTMIAVLPFDNATRDLRDAPMLDGLLDELTTQFGTMLPDRLGVIGRTSVLRYTGQSTPLPRIGGDLGVSYAVEGDLRRERDLLRVAIRLVKVADQSQVWSETFQFEGSGALQFQEDTAARAGAAIVRALFPQSKTPARSHQPAPAALQAFTEGRYLEHQRQYQAALDSFAAAARLDSAYADPLAAAAADHVGLALSGLSPAPENLAQAADAASKALALDDTNAEAHNALGNVALWRDWDYAAARRQFERALALNPSFAQAHHDYAFLLVITGHPESGVAALKRSLALDPLSPRVNIDAGWVLLQAHRYQEAIRQARRALELDPTLREAQGCIARAELYLGKRSAAAFFEKDIDSPDPYRRAIALAELGHPAEAKAALEIARRQHHLLIPLAATEPAFSRLR